MLKLTGFGTKLIHSPFAKDDVNRALHQPIYSNSAFDFESAEQMEMAFQGRLPVHSYSRVSNPTVENFELRIKQITGSLNLSRVAHENNVPLIADSTLTPPNVFRAKDFGVDVEVISSTKCISGGATSIGGLIVDYGTFDWSKSQKLASLAKRFGPFAFNQKLRREVFRNLGACLSPFAAYLQNLGLETLQLRFEKASENCQKLVRFLETIQEVKAVNYPGKIGSPFYEISKYQFGKFPGAILTFDFASRERCFTFLNKLELIKRATNIYDNKTLIIHPASTIYCDFDKCIRESLGVSDLTLRLSLGIEDIEDLKNDILQALN